MILITIRGCAVSRYKRRDQHFNDCLSALSEKPRRRITDAQVCEIIWANSQCVKNQTGHCPLLLFGRQIAEALNAYFWDED